MKLPDKLTYLRKQKGITQLQLAEQMEVSRQAVSRWEQGESVPTLENLKFLSNFYAIQLETLINDDRHILKSHVNQEQAVERVVKRV